MKCQKCSSSTQVLETRVSHGFIKRRRRCLSCGARSTSEERWCDDVIESAPQKPKPAPKPTPKPAKPINDSTLRQRRVEARRKVEDMSYFSADNDYLSDIKGL